MLIHTMSTSFIWWFIHSTTNIDTDLLTKTLSTSPISWYEMLLEDDHSFIQLPNELITTVFVKQTLDFPKYANNNTSFVINFYFIVGSFIQIWIQHFKHGSLNTKRWKMLNTFYTDCIFTNYIIVKGNIYTLLSDWVLWKMQFSFLCKIWYTMVVFGGISFCLINIEAPYCLIFQLNGPIPVLY